MAFIFSALTENSPATLSLSSPGSIHGNTIIGFQFTTGWTDATLSFEGSTDGVNFGPVYDYTGTEISITVPTFASNMVVTLDNALGTIGKLKNVRLRSGTAGAPVDQAEGTTIVPICGAL